MSGVIESQIESDFEGADGESIYELTNVRNGNSPVTCIVIIMGIGRRLELFVTEVVV